MSVDTTETDEVIKEELTTTGDVVLKVTTEAMATVMGIRATEDDPESLALRIAVTGVKGIEYSYDLSFDEIAAMDDEHMSYTVGDLTIMIPVDSVEKLRGAELDLPRANAQGGLVIRNPNRADPMAGIEIELTGDIADKVKQLLEQSINPALDSHGGYANLVGVDEKNNVYIFMGGGCQGCSASAATLKMGIQRSIKEHIPEVLEVIDATDHSQGENPFYE
ncbi:MAG TPA: NifU family protein [Microthrixaceae bacterium]|nr:NifU family protein [Microthrixaceae bacterium]